MLVKSSSTTLGSNPFFFSSQSRMLGPCTKKVVYDPNLKCHSHERLEYTVDISMHHLHAICLPCSGLLHIDKEVCQMEKKYVYFICNSLVTTFSKRNYILYKFSLSAVIYHWFNPYTISIGQSNFTSLSYPCLTRDSAKFYSSNSLKSLPNNCLERRRKVFYQILWRP